MSDSNWLSDAIYGVNDGLAAIFGIVSGVAGFTYSTHAIVVSGGFGALASTLSMGAAALLAARSEQELRERDQLATKVAIAQTPARERSELRERLEAKGFPEEQAARIVEDVAEDSALFLRLMLQERHGWHEKGARRPWKSASVAAMSTAVGGVIPLLPFMVLTGATALYAAAGISVVGHFGAGVAKSVVTRRSWWRSGLEMTAVGVAVGGISYVLGMLTTSVVG